MKWILGIVTLTLVLGGPLACNRGKKVESEKILKDVVVAFCARMTQCQPKALPDTALCEKTMQTALSKNQNLPGLSTHEDELNKCIASIASTECEELFGAKPPKDCEFLQ